MSPEIKMSVSEADAKQIEEIKEHNSKVRRWCRKIQICVGLLTFLFIILALGLPGYFALHDNASCIVLSFGIFLGLAVISQAIWRIADTLLANYIEKSLFIDEDEECIRLILSGEDISPLLSPLLDGNYGICCQIPDTDTGRIGKIYLDVVNEIPDSKKIVLKFIAQNKKVYGWYAEKGE